MTLSPLTCSGTARPTALITFFMVMTLFHDYPCQAFCRPFPVFYAPFLPPVRQSCWTPGLPPPILSLLPHDRQQQSFLLFQSHRPMEQSPVVWGRSDGDGYNPSLRIQGILIVVRYYSILPD